MYHYSGNNTTAPLSVNCPYCGRRIDIFTYTPISAMPAYVFYSWLLCEDDDGGCYKNFVVRVDLTPSAQVFELKEVSNLIPGHEV